MAGLEGRQYPTFFVKVTFIAGIFCANVTLTLICIVASCSIILRHRMTGFVMLSASRGSAVGLAIVVGVDGCWERNNKKAVSAVEQCILQLYTKTDGCKTMSQFY